MSRFRKVPININESAEKADQPVQDGHSSNRKLAHEQRETLAGLALSVDCIASQKYIKKKELNLVPVTAAQAATFICKVRLL